MKAIIELGQESFVKTRELLLRAAVRPITLVMLLDATLKVSLKGDLIIDKETTRKIHDISWIIPLK